MPITIKSTQMKYKNPSTGEYQGVDAIAETTTSQQCALIEAKGEEVLESLPETYTELADDVSALNGAINAKILQPNGRITVPTGSSGVTKALSGLTADYVLVKWNFYTAASGGSVIAENAPPQDMEWSTTTNSFTLKTGGSSSVYCQPVFALPTQLAAT